MEISGLVSALVIGAAVGLLGRLVLPGRQHIGVLWTLVVGVAAALLGSLPASLLGVGATRGVDWIEWLIQVVLAGLGVAGLDRALAGTERKPRLRE
ncbi:GlsB/YeaQ/YmgE family stress response membrane protein [Streptomyces sp. V2I9]|uniref:GlsB/YeaQ/YmgE family stress response membrane protein n=1 Tax=Streptomyces sp. V2I9 TaxID=3042304 RepID=UPI00278B962D|nr:GlsB/YeaQ/YmgE family stress response membrane protein [Streptomyces sp. V2I9]MDQ0982870.1 putative membrane protein YeaQ/YmgE (transglycosylase-associated protein family) [Streptomyces sp. V2I9]